jgi:SSS family solute:Na+ symporter
MQPLDWFLLILPLLLIGIVGVYTQSQMRSVADFMSGGRVAGRYLLAVARGEQQAGAVVFVATFEVISHSGFVLTWWNWFQTLPGLLVAISGFVIYRFRETRAMTLAQFFEQRYSRSFRLFTGMLAFAAGIVNFGIIPAVGARIFVYFLGMPENVSVFSVTLPTYIPLMALFLTLTVLLALSGGLLTVMVTDCLEGMISQVLYLFIIGCLALSFAWPDVSDTLSRRAAGESLLNPFDAGKVSDFNLSYVIMGMTVFIYSTMAWQNAGGYNSAALNAHEARMGGVLGRWREMGKSAVIVLLAVCAMTYLQHPRYAAQSAQVQLEVGRIAQPQIQQQMRLPIALAHLLPTGAKGALCVVMLMGVFGGDATHLHSWGGIFVQDVLVPLRKRPFAPQTHIRALRISIAGVALFAFVFGALFRQTEYINMWWAVTQALFTGGAGAAIIGGLYWKKGTTAGAWTAMVSGSALSSGGILARQIYGTRFPLNGVQISFIATLIAIALYIVISLLTCREDYNLDRLLHRGAYAVIRRELGDAPEPLPAIAARRGLWGRLLGLDEHFTRGDRWVAASLFWWSMMWAAIALVGTIWNFVSPWPIGRWVQFWQVAGIGIPIVLSLVTAVWFTWGGIRDIRALFRRLKTEVVNPLDDGSVVGHRNLDEAMSAGPGTPLASEGQPESV